MGRMFDSKLVAWVILPGIAVGLALTFPILPERVWN